MTISELTADAVSPSFLDKVVVVTGANAGVGLELSRRLARAGAHVVMACRSVARAERARERVLGEVPGARITVLLLDVSDPASIREFRNRFAWHVRRLDVLINNAGIFGVPLSRNSAGHEAHLATNYLGPFSLTGALLPLFRDRPGARIVNVGSLAHLYAKLSPEALNPKDAEYNDWRAYAHSKLALVTYTIELSRRLRERQSNIVAVGAHPGMAATAIADHHPIANPKSAMGMWLKKMMERLVPTVAEAAEPILHAAGGEDVVGGEYYGPSGWLEIAGAPAKARLNECASDQELARRLWATSEGLTGVGYLGAHGVRRAEIGGFPCH
jgi:NAD(P)-dependent dehydrogenase (short-subunit alcohol dehydrogenase family)